MLKGQINNFSTSYSISIKQQNRLYQSDTAYFIWKIILD
jgi:hypothetical protein